jgi:hypothetical protein
MALLSILAGILLFAIAAILIASSVTNAPYLPSDKKSVAKMVALANICPGEKTVDLGSGDGRIVIAMAKAGAEAHGYELNLFLVWWSRYKIRKAKLSGRAFIHWKSFWKEDLGKFQAITMFTLPYFMPRLEKKLGKEMKSEAVFISNASPLPNWQYKIKEADQGIYAYRR